MNDGAELWEPAKEACDVARKRVRFLLTERALIVNKLSLEGLLVNAYLQGVIDGALTQRCRK